MSCSIFLIFQERFKWQPPPDPEIEHEEDRDAKTQTNIVVNQSSHELTSTRKIIIKGSVKLNHDTLHAHFSNFIALLLLKYQLIDDGLIVMTCILYISER